MGPHFEVVSDPITTIDIDREHIIGNQQIILFERSENSEIDYIWLDFYKCNVPGYKILVSDKELSKEERSKYITVGINNVISSDISSEAFWKIIKYVPQEMFVINWSGVGREVSYYKIPVLKRFLDIVVSFLALIVLSPLFIITIIAIKIESPGPVIYKSKRAGCNWVVFDFLKFRSMYIDADKRLKEFEALNQYSLSEEDKEKKRQQFADCSDLKENDENEVLLISDDSVIPEVSYRQKVSSEQKNAFVKIEKDPRITKVGRFIRKYSIDELPQLINILKGDMSIVGNRPLPLYEAEKLTGDEYIARFMAPAGLTGLWQIEKRGDSGSLSPEDRKQLDIKYARNMSFCLDFKIILKTFTNFVQKEDV